jgi:hypothetical protein
LLQLAQYLSEKNTLVILSAPLSEYGFEAHLSGRTV